jgi:23S rRNA (cytidine1920-2'-O)/16S rRNA (cytidine1409-2'-O)-methyltransferase
MIMAGLVQVDGMRVDKPGSRVSPDSRLTVTGADRPFVSRGGLKLERAVRAFGVDFAGKTVLDVGASTGGFTDCALQHGAARVIALDVGYGQLDWKLRSDPRVEVRERTNIRYVRPEDLGRRVDLVTIDVSFISLEKVLPVVAALLVPGGEVVALVKPQFEAGRNRVGKRGVVRDAAVHREVLERVMQAARAAGFVVLGLTHSPIKGPEGNIEYLLHLGLDLPEARPAPDIGRVVDEAAAELGGMACE